MPRLSLGVNLNKAKGLTNNTPTKEYVYPSQLDGGVASACWNVKYSPSYTGSAGLVRNATGVVTEIGWRDHLLTTGTHAGKYVELVDTVSIQTHCGTGSGWLRSTLDTTENGRHLTQTDTSPQPRICNSGVVDTVGNGIPASVFDGIDDFLGGELGFALKHIFLVAEYTKNTTFPDFDGLVTDVADLFLGGDLGGRKFTSYYSSLVMNDTSYPSGTDVLPALNTPKLISSTASTTLTSSLRIGMDRTSAGRRWQGRVVPLIAYSVVPVNESAMQEFYNSIFNLY